MKRILSFIVAITATAFLASAQTDLASIIFSQAGKKVNYIGQYDDNRRDKNGTGISRDKQGNVYVGDFMRGKFSGYGMLIMANNASIKDLPGTTIYVGEWIDGKREGKGTCYSHDGDVIYSGLFSENYPVSPYPTPRPDQTRYFSDTNTQDEYYIGEMRNGKPDGFGMFLTNEGTLAIGKVTAGRRTGVGLLLAGDGNWKMVKWSGYNTYDEISSTADYNTRIATYREVASKQHAEFRQGMLDVASGLIQTLSQSQQIKSGGAAVGAAKAGDGYMASNSSSSGSGSKASSSKKGADCGSAWISASRAYSNYETQLVPNGATTASLSDQPSIRSKMKSLRTKWEARGCPITKSPYE